MAERIVIVGASTAGANAAATLRREGFDVAVTLVGAEPHLPYDRPSLSKDYLRGEQDLSLLSPAEFWHDHDTSTRPPPSTPATPPRGPGCGFNGWLDAGSEVRASGFGLPSDSRKVR